MFDITVITPTHQRPAQLALCLSQFQQQSVGSLSVNIWWFPMGSTRTRATCVNGSEPGISNGPSPGGNGARSRGTWGFAKRGGGIWFSGTMTISTSRMRSRRSSQRVANADLGVVQTRYRCRTRAGEITIPASGPAVRRGGCRYDVCLRCAGNWPFRNSWEQRPEPQSITTDWDWLSRLMLRQPTVRFVPVVIGWHL